MVAAVTRLSGLNRKAPITLSSYQRDRGPRYRPRDGVPTASPEELRIERDDGVGAHEHDVR